MLCVQHSVVCSWYCCHEIACFSGFGGIGGILRWKVDFLALADAEAIDAIRSAAAVRSEAREARAAAAGGEGGGGSGAGGDESDEEDEEGGRGYEGEGDFGDLGSSEPTKTTFEEEVRGRWRGKQDAECD